MHASHDDPVADALRPMREALRACTDAKDRRHRITAADLRHCANAIAAHHDLDAAMIYDGLARAPLDVISKIDTPEGLADLGRLFAVNLGGDASTPLIFAIH